MSISKGTPASSQIIFLEQRVTEQADRIEQLEAALRWFTSEYDKAQPMRQARMHAPECRCVLCAYDNALAALGEKP